MGDGGGRSRLSSFLSRKGEPAPSLSQSQKLTSTSKDPPPTSPKKVKRGFSTLSRIFSSPAGFGDSNGDAESHRKTSAPPWLGPDAPDDVLRDSETLGKASLNEALARTPSRSVLLHGLLDQAVVEMEAHVAALTARYDSMYEPPEVLEAELVEARKTLAKLRKRREDAEREQNVVAAVTAAAVETAQVDPSQFPAPPPVTFVPQEDLDSSDDDDDAAGAEKEPVVRRVSHPLSVPNSPGIRTERPRLSTGPEMKSPRHPAAMPRSSSSVAISDQSVRSPETIRAGGNSMRGDAAIQSALDAETAKLETLKARLDSMYEPPEQLEKEVADTEKLVAWLRRKLQGSKTPDDSPVLERSHTEPRMAVTRERPTSVAVLSAAPTRAPESPQLQPAAASASNSSAVSPEASTTAQAKPIARGGLCADCRNARPKDVVPCELAKVNHLDCLTFLIDRKMATVDDKDSSMRTALHYASEKGRIEVVRFLVSRGAKVNRDVFGWTPVDLAAMHGRLDCLELLLSLDPPPTETSDGQGNSALLWAAVRGHDDCLARLLEAGWQADAPNRDGHTPVLMAAEKCHLGIVRRLLARGAKLDPESPKLSRILTAATKEGDEQLLRMLLDAGVRTNARDAAGLAARNGNLQILCAFLEHNVEPGVKALNEAADAATACDNLAALTLIAEKLQTVDSPSRDPPLSCIAATHGSLDCLKWVLQRTPDSLDALSKEHATPLILAARSGQVEAVRLLVEHKCDIYRTDDTGDSACDAALKAGHEACVEVISTVHRDRKSASAWTVADVHDWILRAPEIELPLQKKRVDYAAKFLAEQVDGTTLLALGDKELKEDLGLELGTRRAILTAIDGLRRRLSNAMILATPLHLSDDSDGEVPRDRIRLATVELGHGEFGMVYKGEVVLEGGRTAVAAVKTLREEHTEKDRSDFLAEARIMRQFDHENVLRLLGTCTVDGGVPLILLEFMALGDLKSFLVKQRVGSAEKDPEYPIDTLQLVSVARDIAAGMEYLASRAFVHRDLAARNLMLTTRTATSTGWSKALVTAKIGDFGMSRRIGESDYYKKATAIKMPVKWMALESLLDRKWTIASDVWSYGVVLYEIFSFGATPYPGVQPQDLAKLLQSGHRMHPPDGTPPAVSRAMEACWNADAKARPTFATLCRIMHDELSEGEKEPLYIQFSATETDA